MHNSEDLGSLYWADSTSVECPTRMPQTAKATLTDQSKHGQEMCMLKEKELNLFFKSSFIPHMSTARVFRVSLLSFCFFCSHDACVHWHNATILTDYCMYIDKNVDCEKLDWRRMVIKMFQINIGRMNNQQKAPPTNLFGLRLCLKLHSIKGHTHFSLEGDTKVTVSYCLILASESHQYCNVQVNNFNYDQDNKPWYRCFCPQSMLREGKSSQAILSAAKLSFQCEHTHKFLRKV